MAAICKLRRDLQLPPWVASGPVGSASRKGSLRRYRREVILPTLSSPTTLVENLGPLPWAWIAAHGDSAFPRCGFDLWWQLRTIGAPYPRWDCPWCGPDTPCTRVHLVTECVSFAARCWCTGVQPEVCFEYPADAESFTALLRITGALSEARRAVCDETGA